MIDTRDTRPVAPDNCPPLEQAVVRFIQELKYEHLDARAHAGISRLMRDQIALQVGISTLPWSEQLLAYAAAHQRPGNSRVSASALTMSAADAAFVNGSYGHGFEYDDAHGPSYSHPGSCVIPAALAIGEELGSSLEEIIVAMVAGYEVYARIGMLAAPELLQRGYHPHGTLSNFGAAAVAAKPLRQLFMQGFWTNVLNPKVVLFFVSFFPQFVSADSAHKALAFLTLGAVFVVMSTLWNSMLAWVAGSVTRRFSGKPGVKKWLDRTVGSAFVGLGLKLATSQR